MQDITEILKKVRQVEIIADRAVNQLFAGQYKSVFRGRGMEFSEVREYEPGDDIRLIDWNVTAREGRPYIKRFSEEREMTVLFLVDISASGLFGMNRSKFDTAIEIAATLMLSASKNNDKVGLITFSDKVVKHFKPRKGKGNVLFLLRELLGCDPVAAPANLDAALEHITRTEKRKCVIFLLSDFLIPSFLEAPQAGSLGRVGKRAARTLQQGMDKKIAKMHDRKDEQERFVHRALHVCGRRHDMIALTLLDPRELEFPNVGFLRLQDAETGKIVDVDTGSRKTRIWINNAFAKQQQQISSTLRKAGVDQLCVRTDGNFLSDLRQFFLMREKRIR